MSDNKDGLFNEFLGNSSQKKKSPSSSSSSSSSESKKLSKPGTTCESELSSRTRRSLQSLSYLAASFRRANGNQTLADDQQRESSYEAPSDSSLKKRYKWLMKFNCAKLNPLKSESSRNVKNKPCDCTCYKTTEGVVEEANQIEEGGEEEEEIQSTDEFLAAYAKQQNERAELLDEAASIVNDEPSTSSECDEAKLQELVVQRVIETTSAVSNDALVNVRLDIRATERARSSESIFTDSEKWVQIFYPADHQEYLDGDEDGDDVRDVLHIASLSNENSIHNITDRKCLQLYYPADLNVESLRALFQSHFQIEAPKCHTQVDYIHYLVPDLRQITLCSFYWGKMDRYEAERLLDGKPEGTFLLRDSAQDDFLFSVSFRKYSRSLHARIEQWNHKFSFDCHDPCVYACDTVCGLIEHYKDPSGCMFFEPTLTLPLNRNFPFSLQHLSRSIITSRIQYDTVDQLELPKVLKFYLKEYHYRQQVRLKRFDTSEVQYVEYN